MKKLLIRVLICMTIFLALYIMLMQQDCPIDGLYTTAAHCPLCHGKMRHRAVPVDRKMLADTTPANISSTRKNDTLHRPGNNPAQANPDESNGSSEQMRKKDFPTRSSYGLSLPPIR